MLDGVVTHAPMHCPHPVQAAPTTGRPRSSSLSASSPTGQTRTQIPHSTSRQVMQRSVSTTTRAMRTSRHPQGGTSSAGVGQTVAQGMVSHITQAVTSTWSAGVPEASPAPLGSGLMACTGQAFDHSPQRVHAAMNAGSGRAPGGRT